MIDLPALAQRLTTAGIVGKSFSDLSRDEVLSMVQAVLDSLDERGWRMPCFRDSGGRRELIVPVNAPPYAKTWKAKDPWLAMHRLLSTLGATDEDRVAYLGPLWRESLAWRLEQEDDQKLKGNIS